MKAKAIIRLITSNFMAHFDDFIAYWTVRVQEKESLSSREISTFTNSTEPQRIPKYSNH